MSSTDNFKNALLAYLEDRANKDIHFATKFNNANKNIEDCNNYILNRIQKLGGGGFTDDEVYGMAVHYYQEENIEIGNPITNCQVFVNHPVELTDEEKATAKDEALKLCIQDQYKKLHKSPEKHKTEVKEVFTQASLFE
jgi:hypothetical protein